MTGQVQPASLIETAYAVHAGPLIRKLTASTRDPAVAEDLTQEAFVRLLIEVQRGRTPDDIGAWLHRVAQNLATSRGRRLSVATRRNGELLSRGIAPSPEQEVVAAEQHRSLRAALAELPPTERQAVVLAAHGYRGSEIASSIGRSDGATRTLLCRARSKLRWRLIGANAT
jgi:RNA polymerase sigma-70 factor (ECF subfamily)